MQEVSHRAISEAAFTVRLKADPTENPRRSSPVTASGTDRRWGPATAGPWNLTLTEAANGMKIQSGTYSLISGVESRAYQSYMNYGPIPYSELLKYNALIQNKGW